MTWDPRSSRLGYAEIDNAGEPVSHPMKWVKGEFRVLLPVLTDVFVAWRSDFDDAD